MFMAVAMAICVASCGRGYHYAEGMVWNTTYHITYDGPEELQDSITAVLNETGRSLSVFDPNSLVSKVNSEQATKVDADFMIVYRCAVEVNRQTDGAFDPTLSPLITSWGFGKGHTCTSDTARIDSLLNFVGIEKTRLRGDTLYKDDVRTQFNFSAIAKGYGCDRIAQYLERNGVTNYLIEIGGEIRLNGVSPSADAWSISIDRPIVTDREEIHDSQAIISLTKGGVATSGNYRNFHTVNGKHMGHTIDRRTGRPMLSETASVTIIAADCMSADAYATACMAMPPAKSKALCQRLNLAAMIVMQDGSVWYSPQFKTHLK